MAPKADRGSTMLQMIKRTLSLFLALALIIAVTVSIARHLDSPRRVANLHVQVCDPPCWIGIAPGITPVTEAFQRVDSTFSTNLAQTEVHNLRDGTGNGVVDIRGADLDR